MADTLTLTNSIPVKKAGDGGGGGGSSAGIMVAHASNVIIEGDTLHKLDKTWQEIKDAIDNDILVFVKYSFEDDGYMDTTLNFVDRVTYDPEIDPELDPDYPYTIHCGEIYGSNESDGELITQGGK